VVRVIAAALIAFSIFHLLGIFAVIAFTPLNWGWVLSSLLEEARWLGPGIALILLERPLIRWLIPDPPRGCPNCGYSLQGLRSPVCPECGADLGSRGSRKQG